jgi:uncharacterized protein (UPF0147 family)
MIDKIAKLITGNKKALGGAKRMTTKLQKFKGVIAVPLYKIQSDESVPTNVRNLSYKMAVAIDPVVTEDEEG